MIYNYVSYTNAYGCHCEASHDVLDDLATMGMPQGVYRSVSYWLRSLRFSRWAERHTGLLDGFIKDVRRSYVECLLQSKLLTLWEFYWLLSLGRSMSVKRVGRKGSNLLPFRRRLRSLRRLGYLSLRKENRDTLGCLGDVNKNKTALWRCGFLIDFTKTNDAFDAIRAF